MKKMLLLLLPAFALSACGQSPESSMKTFCSELSAGKWEKAFEVFGDTETIRTTLADIEKDAQNKQMVQSVFSTAKCSVASAKEGLVTLKVDAVNAQAVAAAVVADSMGLALMSAFSDDGGEAMAQAIMGKLTTALAAKDAPRVQNDVDVQMEQVDGRWAPANGEAFFSAITGGVEKMGQ